MSETLNIRCDDRLVAALERAASDRMTTKSEFIRQAVLDRLRRDGVDPVRPPRRLDQIVPDHYDWLRNYDAEAQNEFQRSARRLPEYELPRQPMADLPRGARIFVDGQAVGSAPPEWSQPRRPRFDSIPSPPLTEAEERERRRQRKARE